MKQDNHDLASGTMEVSGGLPDAGLAILPGSETAHVSELGADAPSHSGGGTGNGEAVPSNAPNADLVTKKVQAAIRYPRQAEKRGFEGTVVVRFHIGTFGAVEDLSVTRSAGEILDRAAMEAVYNAAPFVFPEGWIRVPIDFKLSAP